MKPSTTPPDRLPPNERAYRLALETWGLSRCPGNRTDSLEPIVAALSGHFTDERPDTYTPYLNEADTLTAYALYFAPQTYTRTVEALNGILNRLPDFPKNRPLRILDLGSGIGSALKAAADVINERTGNAPQCTAADWSENALNALKYFIPQADTIHCDLRTAVPKGPYDIILSSFAFNEAFPNPSEAETALRHLINALTDDSPSFVLLLEPASHRSTPRLLALRDRFHDCPLYAPCPHAGTCPMVPTQDGICHDVRRFRPDRLMNRLNRHLHRNLSDIKYTPFALGRPGGPQAEGFSHPEYLRLVGPMDKAKGLIICRACMGDGCLRRLEIPTAPLSADRRHALLERRRGDCAWLDGPLEYRRLLEDGRTQRTADLRFSDEAPPTLDTPPDDSGFSFSV